MSRTHRGLSASFAALLAIILPSCVFLPWLRSPGSVPGNPPVRGSLAAASGRAGETELTAARRQALADSARSLLGPLGARTVKGKTFGADCTGTILAACWGAGLDLGPAMARAKGTNGVSLLYDAFRSEGLLLATSAPLPGDLIFWDDTWDANGNGLADDKLTHVGIVVSARGDGRLSYVHYRYDKGVVEEYMDLAHPSLSVDASGERLNTGMRMVSWKPSGDARSLSGELYRDGGNAPALPSGWE